MQYSTCSKHNELEAGGDENDLKVISDELEGWLVEG